MEILKSGVSQLYLFKLPIWAKHIHLFNWFLFYLSNVKFFRYYENIPILNYISTYGYEDNFDVERLMKELLKESLKGSLKDLLKDSMKYSYSFY